MHSDGHQLGGSACHMQQAQAGQRRRLASPWMSGLEEESTPPAFSEACRGRAACKQKCRRQQR